MQFADQALAKHAAIRAQNHGRGVYQEDGNKTFATACKQATARIRGSGLLASLLYGAKKGGPDEHVAQSLISYLSNQSGENDGPPITGTVTEWANGDARAIQLKTAKALRYLDWLARFADALNTAEDHA